MDICTHCGQPAGSGRFCGNCGIARGGSGALIAPGSAASPFWQPLPGGLVLQRRYTVGALISRGSFGAVYEAEDSRFSGRRRALKELVPVVLSADEFSEATTWFLREAEMLGTLDHAAIPRVWDSFEEGGRLYIVMQFVEGRSLDTILAATGNRGLPPRHVHTLTDALCDVLAYLHAQTPPILFRDLKPANIMLGEDGRLTLIDFGIATRFAPQRIGTTIGTPGYAPPEQYQGLAEPRSDLYALAATLHHLFTGRDPTREPPFSFPPLDPAALGITPALAQVIAAALSFIIDDRPADVEAFRKVLHGHNSERAARQGAPVLVRRDLRHASRMADTPWSQRQRDLMAAGLPRRVAALRRVAESPDDDDQEQARALHVAALWGETRRFAAVGHYAKALAVLDQALGLVPADGELWREKGKLLRQAGRPAEAIPAFQASLRLEPDQPAVLSSLGWCLAHSGHHAEALSVLEESLLLDPLDAAGWAARGWTLACQHRFHEALRALEEATELDPGNAEAWRTRGYCLERLDREVEALRCYQRAQRAG